MRSQSGDWERGVNAFQSGDWEREVKKVEIQNPDFLIPNFLVTIPSARRSLCFLWTYL